MSEGVYEKVAAMVGEEAGPFVAVDEVNKPMIRHWCEAMQDGNPLYNDVEYARESRYGGIIAPPTFILTIGFEQIQKKMDTLMLHGVGRLHGGTELECFQPVRPGDAITASGKIAHVRERGGSKLGKIVFVTFEVSYKNQRQELVAECHQIIIGYKV